MKVLFIVQGEGRGHLTQAISMAQILRRSGHEITGVLVGKSEHRTLPAFFEKKIRAKVSCFRSPNFLPAPANKGIHLGKSILHNLFQTGEFIESIRFIRSEIRESGADLVINFYDLLAGITYSLFKPEVPLVCIAHQYVFLHPDYPFPDENIFSLYLLRLFTRVTAPGASRKLALSIHEMEPVTEKNLVTVPPLLREELFDLIPEKGDYLHGYLLNSGFREELEEWHEGASHEKVHVFWDKEERSSSDGNLHFHALDDEAFLRYMAGCKGYVTTAGFESVCEALYLEKPVFMVPTHIEQACNAHHGALCGIGMNADNFRLEGFERFSRQYRPEPRYKGWIKSGPGVILKEMEQQFHTVCQNEDFIKMPQVAAQT